MYPNPQDALPFPLRPSLEQFKKQAKDLVKASRSFDPDAIHRWAKAWVESLARSGDLKIIGNMPVKLEDWIGQLAAFARVELKKQPCLTRAQFVIARAEGFESWPKLGRHIQALERSGTVVSRFEVATDAIVTGDIVALKKLLQEDPELAKACSTREHRAALLHYVSANGVEGYRQQTPNNIVQIAKLLLESGAEVDALCNVYGGDCTTLGLTATSIHPQRAGVQIELMDLLLEHGARRDLLGSAGGKHTLIFACLANGQPRAAEHLRKLGAPLDFVSAAGLGCLDVVQQFFATRQHDLPNAEVLNAYAYSCGYGSTDVVKFLLDKGVDVNTELKVHGSGHTGLHIAAFHGHVKVAKLLLQRGARVDLMDKTWGTPPLVWALTGWQGTGTPDDLRYCELVASLVSAGAQVKQEWLIDPNSETSAVSKIQADPRMQSALRRATPK